MTPHPQPDLDPLLETLWECGAILFGDRVREEYALQTPVFIDLRGKLHEDLAALEALGHALHARLQATVDSDLPQQVIGIPDTATPLALATALASRKTGQAPIAYGQLRKHPANYPGGRSGSTAYMGVVDPRREITLIDDVMASAKTKLWSMDRLGEAGLQVTRVLVVVDREQGGVEILADRGVPTDSLFRISALIDYFERTGRIDAAVAEAAQTHVRKRRFR